MIVGAFYYDQGFHVRKVHPRCPGVNAYILPGNEFLLEKALAFELKTQYHQRGKPSNSFETCLDNFMKYVEVVSKLKTKTN